VAVDLVGSLIVWMRAQPTISSAGTQVVSQVPQARPDRFILLRRVGGPHRDWVVDDAMLTVEGWGKTQTTALDVCNDARALLHDLRRIHVVNGIAVYNVIEIAGPGWLPDGDTGTPRYTMTVQIPHREPLGVT
jgi:hypothetical protein